jgi:hypothetical protein
VLLWLYWNGWICQINYQIIYFNFRQKSSYVNSIACHSLGAAPKRPKTLDNLELESAQGRYTKTFVSIYFKVKFVSSLYFLLIYASNLLSFSVVDFFPCNIYYSEMYMCCRSAMTFSGISAGGWWPGANYKVETLLWSPHTSQCGDHIEITRILLPQTIMIRIQPDSWMNKKSITTAPWIVIRSSAVNKKTFKMPTISMTLTHFLVEI